MSPNVVSYKVVIFSQRNATTGWTTQRCLPFARSIVRWCLTALRRYAIHARGCRRSRAPARSRCGVIHQHHCRMCGRMVGWLVGGIHVRSPWALSTSTRSGPIILRIVVESRGDCRVVPGRSTPTADCRRTNVADGFGGDHDGQGNARVDLNAGRASAEDFKERTEHRRGDPLVNAAQAPGRQHRGTTGCTKRPPAHRRKPSRGGNRRGADNATEEQPQPEGAA